MGKAIVVMTCKRGHQWAREGQDEANGRVSLGPVSAPGAADDPTTCARCHEAAVRFSVLHAPDDRVTVNYAQPYQQAALW